MKNWEEIKKVLNRLKTPVDYSDVSLDKGSKILFDSFNDSLSKIKQKKIHIPTNTENDSFLFFCMDLFQRNISYFFQFANFVIQMKKTPPKKFQWSFIFQDALNFSYTIGIQSIPVVIFFSIVFGSIMSLQAIMQLEKLGVELFAINLITISFFKEMALFIAVIILAGRSVSSMVAKIGLMKLSDEWKSLVVMKLDPEVFLFQPKIFAFMLVTPFLAYISCFSGILSCYIILHNIMNISFDFVVSYLKVAITFSLFFGILFKGILFGFLLGSVASFEAKKISTNSDNMVNGVTKGVIFSIFICMFFDMLFTFIGFCL